MISQWAYGVRNAVVLSGAGISTDSGIPDFRGPNGVWTLNPGTQKKYTYQAFLDDPQLRGRFWKSRREHPVWQAEPNAGHRALAELTNSAIATTIITQNTDGLHQRAGTPPERVIELHGTMHEVHCVACGHRSPMADAMARYDAGETVPPCLECGGVLKTATIMFSQVMSPEVFERAERAVTGCDLLLAVGTTLNVEPAGSLCATAVRAGASLVIVNWDSTPYDGIAVDVVRDPLGEALPRITARLLAARDLAAPEPSPVGPGSVRRGPRPSALLRDLCHSADEHDLPLSADAVRGAAATAILCGAADERSALAVLGHVSGLADEHVRLRAARWLRRRYPDPARYWAAAMPDPLAEDLVAAAVTPRFLMGVLMETAEEQDRRALTVLARAAATRPALAGCLTELLSVLPGLSPAAVDVALHGGHPRPLADALTSLARKAALPADLLDAVPPGTTVLGEFPMLLTESLVEAYEQRAERRPETVLPGLARLLGDLAGRLTDLGRHEEASAAAARATATSERLAVVLGKAPPAHHA